MKKGRRGAGYLVGPQEGETQLGGIVSTTKERLALSGYPQSKAARFVAFLFYRQE